MQGKGAMILHPLRTYRVWIRVMCGKPPFKPGSRNDRRYQAKLRQQAVYEDAEERAQDEKYAEGYDEAFGDDPIWEMDYD